jgi:hypothetical protein
MSSRKPWLAGVLSSLVPGLGQIYAGEEDRGALILIGTIIVGNLNTIFLAIIGQSKKEERPVWASTLPRFLHDLFAVYGLIFWIWQVVDAYRKTEESSRLGE